MASGFSFPLLPEAKLLDNQNPLLAGATVTHTSAAGDSSPRKALSGKAAQPHRQKVPLEAGYSQMDWLRKVAKRSKDPGLVGRIDVPMSEVRQHRTREDAWTVLRGKVYNITPYLKYHPGGLEMLMKGAGRDCTPMFTKYHAWVNAEMLLKADYIGTLDPSSVNTAASRQSASPSPYGDERTRSSQDRYR